MWDLVPRPGIKPGPPALGAWSLSHWTTRAVPEIDFWLHFFSKPPHFHHEPNTPLFSQLLWGHSPHGVHNVFWVHIQMFCTCHKCDVPVLLAPLVTGSKVPSQRKGIHVLMGLTAGLHHSEKGHWRMRACSERSNRVGKGLKNNTQKLLKRLRMMNLGKIVL